MFNPMTGGPLLRKTVDVKTSRVKDNQVSYFKLFKFASRRDKIQIYLAVFLAALNGAISQLNSLIFAFLFNSLIEYARSVSDEKPNPEALWKDINLFVLYSTSVGLTLIILAYASTTLINIASYNQIFKIRQEFLKAMLGQDFEYFDRHPPGDFTSKMMDDLKKLEDGIGQKLTTFVYFQAMFVTSCIMSLYHGWELALLCLSSFPVTLFLTILCGQITRSVTKKESKSLSCAAAVAEEVLSAIRTVYAFNGQKKEVERYKNHLQEARRHHTIRVLSNGLTIGLLIFCVYGTYGMAVWYGEYLLSNRPEDYTITVCIAVVIEIMSGTSNVGNSLGLIEVFEIARGAGTQIFHVIDRVPKINPYSNKGLIPQFARGHIEFNNVDFHYPSRPDVPVLQGVTLKVKQGQSVALIGQSGSGKSTIIQLICRFYDVVNGSVKIDGIDVRNMSLQWLRAQVSLIMPEPVLFNTNVRHNIRYGREDSTFEEVQKAAQKANAHNFIMNMPEGYETLVGERGATLSGGQKQRIAIARALVREPLVLLLDEATSALDSNAQYKLQQVLENIHAYHTTLIVSKQLSAIRNVDYIYVLDRGKIAESGNHDRLLEKKGLYYQMVQIETQDEEGILEKTNSIDECLVIEKEEEKKKDYYYYDEEEEKYVADEQHGEAEEILNMVTLKEALKLSSPEFIYITIASIGSFLNGFGTPLLVVIGVVVITLLDEFESTQVQDCCVLLVIFGATFGILNFLQTFFFGIAGKRLLNRLREMMFEKMLQQEISFHDRRENLTAILCGRLSAEVIAVRGLTGSWIGTILQVMGTFSMATSLSMYYEWRIGLFSLLLTPIIFVILYKDSKMTQDCSGSEELIDNYLAIEAVTNVRTVASLGREQIFVREYAEKLVPAMAAGMRSANWRGLLFGLAVGILNLAFAATLYFASYILLMGSVSTYQVLGSSNCLILGANSSALLFTNVPNYRSGIEAASRTLALLKRKPKILETDTCNNFVFRGSGETSLEGVIFSYPNRPNTKVLNGLTLKVEKGTTVALVGLSGNGKSTIVHLLLRFYDPCEGQVCQDGVPLTAVSVGEVRHSIGLVQQEPILFDRTIAENIAYGDNSRTPTMSEIVGAAQQANIHDFIQSLPSGYETHIGSKGTLLSVGQKQRIAIARALIRRPNLLLLDEATSALDSVSEMKVQEALDKAKAGRTCLMIVHSLRLIRDVDLIAVVNAGRIVEQGTHASLMEAKGIYYAMYKLEKQL